MCYWYVSIEPFAEVYLLLIIRINSELGFSFLYVFHFFMHFLLSFPVETPQDSSLNSTCVKRKRKIHKTTQTRWTTIKRIRLRPSQKRIQQKLLILVFVLNIAVQEHLRTRNIVTRLVKQSVRGKEDVHLS